MSKTLFLTCLIKFSKSVDLAFPLLTKKLQCFSEIYASPTFKPAHPESFISDQALLFSGFLKVLPHVFILDGWSFFFLLIQLKIFCFILIFLSILIYFFYQKTIKENLTKPYLISKETAVLLNNLFMMFFEVYSGI